MSKAFTKEDDDIPERTSRKRTSTGLPPGAVNYMTEKGERVLREELAGLESCGEAANAETLDRIAWLRELLASVTVVPARSEAPTEALFGTTVTIQNADGTLSRHRIVGVDETDFEPEAVSWLSPLARSLLGARVGQYLQLPDGAKAQIMEIVG
jgi:transcription elongation factor GreB